MDATQLANFFTDEPLTFQLGRRHHVPLGDGHLHAHEGLEIAYHRTGAGCIQFDDGRQTMFERQSVEIYPPSMAHKQDMLHAGDDLFIRAAVPVGVMSSAAPPYVFLSRLTDDFARRELEDLSALPPELSRMQQIACNHRVTALFIHLLMINDEQGPRLQLSPAPAYAREARRYIAQHFQTIGALDEVAAHLGISLDYLRHVFKQAYGKPLIRELVDARIEHGKRLLLTSTLPLKAIARECGFQNQRYFCRVFHQVAGCPPGSFRRSR